MTRTALLLALPAVTGLASVVWAEITAMSRLLMAGLNVLAYLVVLASGAVGAAIDSALFLGVAFGSLDHFAGQVVGKLEAVAFAVTVIALLRRSAIDHRTASKDGSLPNSCTTP